MPRINFISNYLLHNLFVILLNENLDIILIHMGQSYPNSFNIIIPTIYIQCNT